MKRTKFAFISLSTVLLLSLFSCGNSKSSIPSMKFSYPAGSTKDYSSTAYYTDDYFSNPSTTYNASLATASLCFAMSSFATNTSANSDYSHRYLNAESLLKSFGFGSITPNADYKKKPETDTIGLIYANKKIGDDTMIAVGVRGANYQQEWASNVTVGTYEENTYHKGFYTAGKQLVDELKDYIDTEAISGSIKLWITGYSRAGATANISSGLLDKSLVEKSSLLGDQVTFAKEDIYAYCFEPPQGVYYDDELDEVEVHGDNYNNIFNIINGNDPVPMVAMNYFNFTRFGIDKYLSYRLTDKDYSSNIEKVKNAYSSLAAYSDLGGEYLVDDFSYKSITLSKDKSHINWTQGLYLQELTTTLGAKLGTRNDYVANAQEGLRDVFTLVFKNGMPKGSFIDLGMNLVKALAAGGDADVLMDDLTHSSDYFVKDLLPLLQRTMYSSGIDIDVNVLFNDLEKLLSALVGVFAFNPSLIMSMISSTNVKSLASSHYPDICLANMQARDPNYTSDPITSDMSGRYYHFESTDYEKSFVIKKDGKTIAQMTLGEINDVSSSITYAMHLGRFVAYFPIDSGYSIELEKGTTGSLYIYEPSKIKYVDVATIDENSSSATLDSNVKLVVK